MPNEEKPPRLRKEADEDKIFAADTITNLKEKRQRPAYEGDIWFYRIVAGILGASLLASLIGMLCLAYLGEETPQGIVALGSGSLGALAGVFAMGRGRK